MFNAENGNEISMGFPVKRIKWSKIWVTLKVKVHFSVYINTDAVIVK